MTYLYFSLFFMENMMPNHISHDLKITGPIEDVAALKVKIKGIEKVWDVKIKNGRDRDLVFDFSKVVPTVPILEKVVIEERVDRDTGKTIPASVTDNPGMPFWSEGSTRPATPEESEEIKATGYDGWYTWRLDHWGTKWNAYNERVVKDEATFQLQFDTAWAAPIPILDKLKEEFPTLTFDACWFDEGWGFSGDITIGPNVNRGASFEKGYREPNPAVFEKVYGVPPLSDEFEKLNDLDEGDHIRLYNNDHCHDVAAASDENGYFEMTSIQWSDDPDLNDHDMVNHVKDMQFIIDAANRHG